MSKKSAIKGGIIGVIIGAVTGILFAPKSGKETRKDLREAAIKANKEAEKKLKELHTELQKKLEEAKKTGDLLSSRAKAEVDKLAEQAEELKKRISKAISAVREFEADDDEVEATIRESEELLNDLEKTTKSQKK